MATNEVLLANKTTQESFVYKMFRTKPIATVISEPDQNGNVNVSNADKNKLKKVLTIKDLIAFGIASAVGSGIYVIAGTAGKYAGAGLFLSFIFGGIACCFSGLCYAEFSTRVPIAGSAYTYAYCSLGEIVGFLIGWDLTLEYSISAATIAQGWSSYLLTFLQNCGVEDKYLPSILFGYNINDVFTINILAGILIILCTVLLMYGIKESAKFTNFITIWNVLLIIIFIISGMFFFDLNNWINPCEISKYRTSCDANDSNSMFPKGIQGVFRGAGIVFFSYVGFDAVSCLAEETSNPQKSMVWGILGTLLIATSLYVGVSMVLLGMVPFTALDSDAPLADAFKVHHQRIISIVVSFGALTTTSATTLTCLIGQPRIFYTMALDGLCCEKFGKVDNKYKTPIYGSLYSGVFAAVIGIFINFNLLAEMISVGTLMAYTLVCGGIIILRYPINNGSLDKKIALFVTVYTIGCLSIGFLLDNLTSIGFNNILLYFIIFVLIVFLVGFIYMNKKYVACTPERIFVCPYVPYIPALGIFINCYFIASLKWDSFVRVFVWFLLGLAIYIFYGSKHSKMNKQMI